MIGYDVHDEVAVITIDNPPVNVLGPAALDGIVEAVARAIDDTVVRALVIIGAGRTFAAGVDIHVFTSIKTRDEVLARCAAFHTSLRQLEDASKPVVAAIHGYALGGGLELAMACHVRIAAATAEVGQPEVLLGLIPGAGGTQRLPRLAGVPLALDMCIDGKPIRVVTAHAAGLVDAIVDGDRAALLAHAIAVARKCAATGDIRRTRDQTAALADISAGLAACDRRRAQLAESPTPVLAPSAAVSAIEAACRLPFDAGSLVERELFADCLLSIESRSLVHLFFAERDAAKVSGIPKSTPAQEIRHAAVIGAGTKGGDIAMVYTNAGIPVLLKTVDEGALTRIMATIRARYESTMALGKMTADALEHAMALITPTTRFNGFDTLDIVCEAMFEDRARTTAMFAALGRVTRPDCVLASNSSTIDIDELARVSGRASHVVGHHFIGSGTVMTLVEIVRGRETSAETIVTSQKLVTRLAQVGVVVGNCRGFVANRMLACYLREAYFLLEEGAAVAQIDRALTTFGMPVGPFEMEDIAGIDVGARIARRGLTPRVIGDEEIVARATTALANEGARIVEEGYASRASDIDVIGCYGFGFPRYRGGPMFYADTVGLRVAGR